MLIGFANGCFDLFHAGHYHFITECLNSCDWLIVGVNSDQSVKELKGQGRPQNFILFRLQQVSLARDFGKRRAVAVPFDGDPKPLIQAVKPQIIFRGEDQTITDFERAAARIQVIPRLPGFSTTEELAKLQA
jgi:D-beta-D-heptose 7-phosphate kinase/D-beta-D-heptose 1-phosphate adenosyltransferase